MNRETLASERSGPLATTVALGLLGATLAWAVVAELRAPINHDVSWLLWVSDQMRHGRSLYRDLLEINPPLILWFDLLPISVASILHVAPAAAYRLLVAAGIGALLWRWRTLPTIQWLTMAVVLGPLASSDTGQRDHLALLLLLPLLLRTITDTPGVRAGIAAGLAVGLKPFIAAAWLLSLLRRRPGRADVAVLITGGVYLVAVAILAPSYWSWVMTAAPSYRSFDSHSMSALLVGPAALACLACVAVWVVFRRRGIRRRAADVWLSASVGFLIAVLLQGKGWTYHWYPVLATTLLAVASLAADPPPRPLLRASLVLLTLGVLAATVGRLMEGQRLRAERALLTTEYRDLHRRFPLARTAYVLSIRLTDAWPGLDEAGLAWGGRLPHLWYTRAETIPPVISAAVQEAVDRAPDLLLVATPDIALPEGVRTRYDSVEVMGPLTVWATRR